MSAMLVLRDKVIKPLLAAACPFKRGHKPKCRTTLDGHYQTLRQDFVRPESTSRMLPSRQLIRVGGPVGSESRTALRVSVAHLREPYVEL